ncbi:MAG TPA: hypothetical protein VFI42_18850 [Thermomicrobiaceae bacterium]|nr:hypothetical protein [Thermomicrobiaceae bacterium]
MRMRQRQHSGLVALEAFAAISAIGGGIGLAGGGLEFPLDWLAGTPFTSYTVPGLILGVVVGGSQLIALVASLRHASWAMAASLWAGVIMLGWIVGEVLIVGSHGGVMIGLQALYFIVGLLIAALAYRERDHDRAAIS